MPVSVRAVSTGSHDTGTVTVSRPSGTTSGDRLIAICSRDEGSATAAWGSNLFTLINQTTVSGRGRIQVWERTAGGSEPASYTYTDSSGNSTGTVHLFAVTGAVGTTVASFANGSSTSNTAPSIASGSYTGNDPLLLTGHYANVNYSTTTFSTPASMTSRGLVNGPAGYTQCFAASIELSGNPATSARTSTLGASKPWIAVSVVVPGSSGPTTVSSSDTVTLTDTTSALARTSTSTDSITLTDSTDLVGVAILNITDTVTLSDTNLKEVPVLKSSSDSATITDSTALGVAHSVTDSATISDATASGLIRRSTVTDTTTITDLVPSRGLTPVDSFHIEDSTDVVVIPFTQFVAPIIGTVYDLVCVARLPSVSGDPTFVEIDPIEWKSLDYTNTLSQSQSLTAKCQISSVTETVLQRLRDLATQPTEFWLYRNGKIVFAGPIIGGQLNGEELTLNCLGIQAYTKLMWVTSDLKYKDVDQFSIVKGLVDHWQSQQYGNFGIDTSAVGTSGVLRTIDYLRDESNNIGQKIEDLGKGGNGFDVEVDPASRKLLLSYPYKGVDRSSGEDAIVIDSRNISSGDIVFSAAIGDLASEAFGTSKPQGADETLYSAKSNAELRAKFGRAGIFQSFTDIPDQGTLDQYTQALIDARGNVLMIPGPKVRVTPDADLSDYTVGDTIAYELGSALGVTGSFRIRSMKVSATSTGQESVDLEFT